MNGVTAEQALKIAGRASRSRRDADTPEQVFPLLRDLVVRPELLRPPEEVLSHLVWRSRTTGLVGADKSGKSTLAGHGVAAKSNGGEWLGSRTKTGQVVVAAPDEAVGDTVRRLHELSANASRVRVLCLRPPDLFEQLEALLNAHSADLVIVDSLAEWARLTLGRAPDDGDAAGWGAVVRPLVQLSRECDAGVLVLHHPRRSDGAYRGSGEIAAAFDCLIEMSTSQAGEDPTLRRFRSRARWPVEDWSLRMESGQFVAGGGGELSLESRILVDVRENPGTTRNAQHHRLGGRRATYLAAVRRLTDSSGLIERDTGLYTPGDVEEDLL